ncbi:unnamed protein product [Amoebophrya sp. A120]|nr:unnamed protein product [Amoebophrya sp. A120]|eukprot:GSA120T00010120001.1
MCCHRDGETTTAGEEEKSSMTYRNSAGRTERLSSSRELRGSIESDSTYSSYSSEALPYDEDLVVISNKHVGCCYCLNTTVWLLLGGLEMFIFWCLAGLACALSIVGFSWAKKCFSIACIVLMPWKKSGRGVVKKHIYYIRNVRPNYCGIFMWYVFPLCAPILSILHLVFALLNLLTLIGIPFAYQHFKWAAMVWRCGAIALTLEEAEQLTGSYAKAGYDSEENDDY